MYIYTNVTAETHVIVRYKDGTDRHTTIAELEALFSDETKEWRSNFFTELCGAGKTVGAFATYSLEND